MDCEGLKAMNDLDYDPFASIDLMKMEDEVRSDQVKAANLKYFIFAKFYAKGSILILVSEYYIHAIVP